MMVGAGTDDAVKGPVLQTVRGALPDLEYIGLYRAEVVAQSGDLATVDLEPNDPRLPPMSNIPLKVGIPGATAKLAPGAGILVGWENGDPAAPQAFTFDQGAVVLKLTLNADVIQLGGDGLDPIKDGVVRAETPCQFTGSPHFIGGKTSLVVLAKAGP